MKATSENNTQYRVYDSVQEMLAAVATVEDSRVHSDPTRAGFVGREFSSWGDAYAAARSEWGDGIVLLEGMLAELGDLNLPRPKSRKRRTRFEEAGGDEVDYDRLRGGQDFWRLTRRESSDGPSTVTLFIAMTTPGVLDSEQILWRGAAAIVLAKLLEEAGYRVELWAVSRTDNCYPRATFKNHCTGVCLKRTSDPIDTSTLINAVSGWFYRTINFREKSVSKSKVDRGLGHCTRMTVLDLDQFTNDAQRHVVEGVWDRAAAIRFIREKLAELAS